ncbi:MAG: signal peptidase I [Erysipelotrichaceae bacterium]
MVEKIKLKVLDFFATLFIAILIYLDEIIDSIVTVFVTVIVSFVVVNFFFMPIVVNGQSMYPALHDNSYGFSNIFARRISSIERFDIVVIYLEERDENLVKRVIGLPNETITFTNDTLYVNGTPIDQTFLDTEYVKQIQDSSYSGVFTADFTIVLGDNEYFCMGDNRPKSADSRSYGPFNKEQIISKDVFIIFPFDLFGIVE